MSVKKLCAFFFIIGLLTLSSFPVSARTRMWVHGQLYRVDNGSGRALDQPWVGGDFMHSTSVSTSSRNAIIQGEVIIAGRRATVLAPRDVLNAFESAILVMGSNFTCEHWISNLGMVFSEEFECYYLGD